MAHHCHGKRINLTAKRKTSQQKEKDSRQNFFDAERTFFILFSFAVRLFFLPWVFFFLQWGFSFYTEVFLFALRLFLFPWQSAGPAIVPLKFCSWRFLVFFNMWVFARTSTNFAHFVSFHYSSHRIRGLARSENAGHFCMSDKWKQSFENAALSPRFPLGAHRNNVRNESSSLENPLGN